MSRWSLDPDKFTQADENLRKWEEREERMSKESFEPLIYCPAFRGMITNDEVCIHWSLETANIKAQCTHPLAEDRVCPTSGQRHRAQYQVGEDGEIVEP